MLKKSLGIVLSLGLVASMFVGCVAPSEETVDEGTPEKTSPFGQFESEDEQVKARDLMRQGLEGQIEWALPEDASQWHLNKIEGFNGKVFYDGLVYDETGEHNAFIAVTPEGEIVALDVDREVVIPYSPEYVDALNVQSSFADDISGDINEAEAQDTEE